MSSDNTKKPIDNLEGGNKIQDKDMKQLIDIARTLRYWDDEGRPGQALFEDRVFGTLGPTDDAMLTEWLESHSEDVARLEATEEEIHATSKRLVEGALAKFHARRAAEPSATTGTQPLSVWRRWADALAAFTQSNGYRLALARGQAGGTEAAEETIEESDGWRALRDLARRTEAEAASRLHESDVILTVGRFKSLVAQARVAASRDPALDEALKRLAADLDALRTVEEEPQ